jgi:hypothetical protein
MCMLTHQLQILIDDERYERVRALARQRGTSVAAVITAIHHVVPDANGVRGLTGHPGRIARGGPTA